jgi:hypothetical protein
VSVVVLDAGALVAIERNDRALWAALRLAGIRGDEVCVPSGALAQVWRGTPRQAMLAKALQHCVIASFDAVARAIGELCGRTGTRDVVDAQVAMVAGHRADVLYTSDPGDLRRLLAAVGRRRPTIVRC